MNMDHPDFQILFDGLLYMAKRLLTTRGEFLPIGAVVSHDGELAHVGAKTQEEYPGASTVLQVLQCGLKDMAEQGDCRAAGVAMDARLNGEEWKDAIWMSLEEVGGGSQGILVPYAKSSTGAFTFGDPAPALDHLRVFARGTTNDVEH